jgi:tRNA nucleotidyltransferase/poly(A) polymerase
MVPYLIDVLKVNSSLEGISAERIRDEFLKGLKSAKSTIFFLEMLDSFNLFDCFVVMMSFVDIATSGSNSNLAIIKAFRLLRIFKLFKDWDAIKDLISTLTKSIKPIVNLGVLMLLFNFISSLLLKNINGQTLYDYEGNVFYMNFNTTG